MGEQRMREIKFRAWDEVRKKMFSAEEMGKDELTINPDGRGFVNVCSTNTGFSQYMKHMIPLQFTGLKDKDGKEIYEKDILKCLLNKRDESYWKGTVNFSAGYFLVNLIPLAVVEEFEVIGNIFENPELLEEKDGNQTS